MRRRGRIRPKSAKRPKWENVPLRREYIDQNPHCELFKTLEGEQWEQLKIAFGAIRWHTLSVDPHHICHRGGRWDVWSNLIAASSAAHRFCHQFPVEGTIACFAVKLSKKEFDRAELREVWGQDAVSWVEWKLETHEMSEHYRNLGLGILEAF